MNPVLSLLGALALALPATAAGDAAGERPVVTLEPVEVSARRIRFDATETITARADLTRALSRLGYSIVRRGVPLGADLAADGFRRGDIAVVVDGQRYHSACPNRMDPPTSLALPIEIESATREYVAGAPTAGLAGQLSLQRSAPSRDLRARGGLTLTGGSGEEGDASVALEGRGHRLAARWARGESHRDARGASFGDRYGYREEDVWYSQADAAARVTAGAVRLGLQGTRTRDVPFAYLLMDERENDLWNASAQLGDARAYVNHARHRMDNGLRVSSMRMRTLAEQTTVGLAGRAAGAELEGFWREWDADNEIAMGATLRRNHLIPGYHQWSANASRPWTAGPFTGTARIGWTRGSISDRPVLAEYRALHAGAQAVRTYVPFSASAGWRSEALSAVLEAVLDPPGAEQLYVLVRRPPAMTGTARPDWIGNPELRAPVRTTLRGGTGLAGVELQVHGSFVADAVQPAARMVGMRQVTTFENVDAASAGLRIERRTERLDASVVWTAGWNLTRRRPLSEIPPVTATIEGRWPLRRGFELLGRVQGAGRQSRVDDALGETGTPGWARLDLGMAWHGADGVRVAIEVENVTDAYYAEHLSYLRDPFASGTRVTEPGRSVRLALSMGR